MFKKLSFILLGAVTVFSGGNYLFADSESNLAYAKEPEQLVAEVETKKIASTISGFAYLEQPDEYFTFLEEEVQRKEMEAKKLEEEKKAALEAKEKEIAEKLAKIEKDKKEKAEAEKRAKAEEERLAKEAAEKAEAERIAKEKAEAARAAEKAAQEKAAKEKAEKERIAKYNEAQKIKADLEKKASQKTASASNVTTKSAPKAASNSDLEALAKIIHAEAKGESYQGKLAVGAVILNRVDDSRFPNSVTGVIMAPKQFQPVTNGAYQNARPTDADYKAAREALNGSDPTGGATFFYAPTIATTKWHETLTYTTTIGGHKFFRN